MSDIDQKSLTARGIEKSRKWSIPDLISSDKTNPSTALTGDEEDEEAAKALRSLVYGKAEKYMSQEQLFAFIKDFEGAIAQVFSTHGGSENFVNLRSPGMREGKISADGGNQGDYGRQAVLTHEPEWYDPRQLGSTQSVGRPTPDRTHGLSDEQAARQTYESDRRGATADSRGVTRPLSGLPATSYVDYPSGKIPDSAMPSGLSETQQGTPYTAVSKGFLPVRNNPSSLTKQTTSNLGVSGKMDTSAKTTPGSPAGTGLIKDTAYTFMHVANPALGGDEVAKAIAKRYGATTLQKSVRMSDATADGLTPPSIPLAEDDEEGRRRNEEAERLEMRAQFYEKQAALRQFEGAIGDAQTLRQKAMTARNDALQIRTSRTRNPGYVGL